MAEFPGNARDDASSFVIDNVAYVGLGFGEGFQYEKDFYSFSEINGWKKIKDFPGVPRQYAAAFVYNNKGYIFGGYSSLGALNDLWEYHPQSNEWKQI
jgi:N-acetylneuraminic acid mutarotase